MATTLGVTVIVVIEPFFCDSFLAGIGGHFLFDVVLFLNSVFDALNSPASATAATEVTKKAA